MEEKKMAVKPYMIYACIVLLIIVTIFTYYYVNKIEDNNGILEHEETEYLFDNETENDIVKNVVKPDIVEVESNAKEGNEIETDIEDNKVLREDCVLVFITRYLACNHIDKKEVDIDRKLIGLNKENFQNIYPIWEIESFESQKVILKYEINDYCNHHYILKELDGKIGVFYLNETMEDEIKQTLDVNINNLREEDKNILLSEGIIVHGDENLAQIIEDFTS
jgi:hypothetical protein